VDLWETLSTVPAYSGFGGPPNFGGPISVRDMYWVIRMEQREEGERLPFVRRSTPDFPHEYGFCHPYSAGRGREVTY
jgi:hypothetical protein